VCNLFELAHSWGYPHPDLMFAQITALQAMEMLAYLNRQATKQQRAETLANESKLHDFFRAKMKSNG
jgi:hypothetical protein